MLTLRIQQMTIDGHPYLCPECLSEAFTLDGTGFLDGLPARGNCWQSHSWEDPLITVGVLRQIDEARTGRERAEDDDTFETVVGGAVLAGTLHPDLIADDLRQAVKRVGWQRILKPALRRQKRNAIRAVKRPLKNGAAAAKATALEAAWTTQAGGYQPDPDHTREPINPCPACEGKGSFKLDTRIHDTTPIRCTVCRGTGDIN